MLRVGLTGGLGSGKSTVAQMLGAMGAEVTSSDELAHSLMSPGRPVYCAVLDHFGSEVLSPDGTLNRQTLARIAFQEGRVEELNSLVHPAVIQLQAEQAAQLERRRPDAVLVVESALLFETRHAGERGWQSRFDRIVLVVAPETTRLARFVARDQTGRAPGDLEAEARRRMAQQISDECKSAQADWVLSNDGSLDDLHAAVDVLWPVLQAEADPVLRG